MNIFVGNLSFDAGQEDVKKLFEGFGSVISAAIVMEKQKKAAKSRGFGFVEMPDEQQAVAAIAALNAKEFMGRVLVVEPERPKIKGEPKVKKVKPQAKAYPKVEDEQKKTWFSPVFRKPGGYKGGRRTHSYLKKRGLTGAQEEAKPRRSSQDNPMRWRKRKDQAKPWQKKTEGIAKPWAKSARLALKSKYKISKNQEGRKK